MKRKKVIKWGIIGALILIAVILAIVLPLTLSKKDGGGNGPITPVAPHYNPYKLSKDDVKDDGSSFSGIIKAPNQYNRAHHLSAVENIIPVLQDGTKKLGVESQKIPHGPNNMFSSNVKFMFDMQNQKVAHLTLTDNDKSRFSIPEIAVPNPQADETMRLAMLGFSYDLEPFSFSFCDSVNPDNVYLTTKDQSLVFMDKFIQMDFLLPSQRLYGFGERVHDFQLDEGTWTMWAIGLDSPVDDGTGRKGVYGVHPFVMVQTANKGDFIGIFFRNSNAQSPIIKYTADGKSILSYITIGGQMEVFFFIHGSAKDIISQYQTMFGKPNLPPFWSLGWQQASWKYTNRQMIDDVIDNYYKAEMPLETIYLDIPYMDNYADFTVDQKAFPKLQELAKRLHDAGQRLVVIIDAAIAAEDITENNKYYTMGNKDDVFIKSGIHTSEMYNNNLISKVWPETAVFVDWFNDKCANVWQTGLNDLYNLVNYDGIWIDMNEPTTFWDGEKIPTDAIKIKQEQRFLQSTEDNNFDYNWYYHYDDQTELSTYDLPFIPRFNPDAERGPFTGNYDYMTLSLNATLPGLNGGEKEYNVHSLYGHMMAKRTQEFLHGVNSSKPDDRSFILTRSTFATSGKYASHWLGDNWRDWAYMKYSIAGMMNMNMFGIPHVGADVCGFFGEKKEDEMCARWIQLATFYPLARTHQNLTFNDKPSEFSEPYLLEGKYKDWAKSAIKERFRYLRHQYTCLYELSVNGGSCIDPLFYHFPDDENVYQNYSQTFIFGNAIKVSPVLESLDENTTVFQSYFPKGTWVSLNNFASIIKSEGAMYDLPADQPTAQAHLKPGSLIADQKLLNSQGKPIMTTNELLAQPISIIVNRDENNFAQGTLFLDEGISRGEIISKEFEYYTVLHQAKSIQFQLSEGTKGVQDNLVDQFVILNAKDLNSTNFACYMDSNKQFTSLKFEHDDIKNALFLTPNSRLKFHEIVNVYYGGNGDVNLCNPATFQYRVPEGQSLPNLTEASAEVELEHSAGTLPNILVTMRVIETDIVNVKWTWKRDQDGNLPPNVRESAEVPNDILDTNKTLGKIQLRSLLSLQANPFQVDFKYRSDSAPSNVLTIKGMLFDSYLNWIEVTANTPKDQDFSGVFGLGERANKDFFLKDGVYSMWSRDQPTPDEEGTLPGANMYGVHPYFMYKHKQGAWVGVLYKLAHAQDWWVKNNINVGTVDLSTIATGGVADIYVMQGQTPDAVVSSYFRLIGNPVLVPQWAFGWNQCRWGYKSVDALQEVVDKYAENKLPLDVQWSDIDYLKEYKDFEYDPKNFGGLPDFIDSLHKNNMRYVPILDAGIAYRPKEGEYPAFQEAEEKGLFVKINDETLVGKVWPNDAAYPDYFHPDTTAWLHKNLDSLQESLNFDGLWEDMNEASNFCNGACLRSQQIDSPVKQKLSYTPTGRDLEIKSMPLDATHHNGLLQLDAHSYYGTQMVKASHEWFAKNNKRTFIIERSSFAGMGKFSSRWLGDNFSNEVSMGYSVSGTMMMNIFGIPFTGSDICGFIGNTTAELCARWHTVGAFYPFSRNHNNWGQLSQEPYSFGDQEYESGVKYIDIMRDAILMKYQLIRYYYSSLFKISTKGTGTFYKPVFFEFPDDVQAYSDITFNVMLGDALKLSINSEVLNQNTTNFYFPAGTWCDIIQNTKCINSTGQQVELPSKAQDFGLHLRQGFMVPFQNVAGLDFSTTVDLQNQPIELHILGQLSNPDSTNWRSQGEYINDDGTNLTLTDNVNWYNFVAESQETILIKFFQSEQATNFMDTTEKGCYAVNQNDYLKKIFIYNAQEFKNDMDYTVTATQYGTTDTIDLGSAKYNKDTDRVEITLETAVCMTKVATINFVKVA